MNGTFKVNSDGYLIYTQQGVDRYVYRCVLHRHKSTALLISNRKALFAIREVPVSLSQITDPYDIPDRQKQLPSAIKLLATLIPLYWTGSPPASIAGKNFDVKTRTGIGDTADQLRFNLWQLYIYEDTEQGEILDIWARVKIDIGQPNFDGGSPPGYGP